MPTFLMIIGITGEYCIFTCLQLFHPTSLRYVRVKNGPGAVIRTGYTQFDQHMFISLGGNDFGNLTSDIGLLIFPPTSNILGRVNIVGHELEHSANHPTETRPTSRNF